MNNEIKISSIQVRGLIVSTVIGVGILTLPFQLADSMENKGWIAIIIAGLLMIPVIYMIIKLFEQNPDKDFFQIGEDTLGVFLFTICKIIFLAYLIVILSAIVRDLGELIKAFLLPTTPLRIIIIAFIVSCSYIASYEVDVIARTGYFTYPIILAFVIVITLISLPNAEYSNLLPITNLDFSKIPKGIQTSFFSLAGFEIIIFALPYVEDKKKVYSSSVYGMAIVVILYIVTYIMTITHFSIAQIQRQNYPVLQLVKKVEIPGFFVENLDGLVMAIWVLIIFATFAPVYFGAGKVLSKIFNTKKHKYFIWGLIPVIYYLSTRPENLVQLTKYMGSLFNILWLISAIGIPALILVVDTYKKKVKS